MYSSASAICNVYHKRNIMPAGVCLRSSRLKEVNVLFILNISGNNYHQVSVLRQVYCHISSTTAAVTTNTNY
jgi:hypothetical protein